jgi:hypothetical protein
VTSITAKWLEQRGGLHDARVLSADADATTVRITIDDEWANEHDGGETPCAGTLVVQGAAILEGDLVAIPGGWISEVAVERGRLVFDFCDRERLVIRSSSAVWSPTPSG